MKGGILRDETRNLWLSAVQYGIGLRSEVRCVIEGVGEE